MILVRVNTTNIILTKSKNKMKLNVLNRARGWTSGVSSLKCGGKKDILRKADIIELMKNY